MVHHSTFWQVIETKKIAYHVSNKLSLLLQLPDSVFRMYLDFYDLTTEVQRNRRGLVGAGRDSYKSVSYTQIVHVTDFFFLLCIKYVKYVEVEDDLFQQ